MKRDYVVSMPQPDAAPASRKLAIAFERHDEKHLHGALQYGSPREFRRSMDSATLVRRCVRECTSTQGQFLIGVYMQLTRMCCLPKSLASIRLSTKSFTNSTERIRHIHVTETGAHGGIQTSRCAAGQSRRSGGVAATIDMLSADRVRRATGCTRRLTALVAIGQLMRGFQGKDEIVGDAFALRLKLVVYLSLNRAPQCDQSYNPWRAPR